MAEGNTHTLLECVMVEILDGRVGNRSVEQVRYVINTLLHLVIVKSHFTHSSVFALAFSS